MTNIYCTYFNESYLNRGIVLYRSLRKFVPDSILEVLCIDDNTYDFLVKRASQFPGVIPCRVADFESRHPDLVAVKPTRTFLEYLFTCSSVWTSDVAARNQQADFITYLDADMMLFSSPAPVLEQMDGKDILICAHNYANPTTPETYAPGVFNVGWLTFRTSPVGMECLTQWANDCIEWCYDRVEGDKYADQKYLDAWPARYGDKLMIAPRTLDYGPWGIWKNDLSLVDNTPCVQGEPIIAFHYSGLRILDEKHYTTGCVFDYDITTILRLVYEPHIKLLTAATREFNLNKCRPARNSKASFIFQLFNVHLLDKPFISCIKRALQSRSLPLMDACGINTIKLKLFLERLFASRDNNLLT